MPQYRRLVCRRYTGVLHQGLYPVVRDVVISPTPKTVNVNARQIAELASRETIQISSEDFYVRHISRVNFNRKTLLEDVEMYILDYSQTGDVITGIPCKPIFLDESRTTSYDLILKRMGDHRQIEKLPEVI